MSRDRPMSPLPTLPYFGLVALTTCALATACQGGSSRVEPVQIRGNSLALIDPKSDEVVADVPVGKDPTRVAYGDGAFWVVSPEAGIVVRVDAETKAAKRFHIGKDPYDVATGGGALWIPDHDGRRLFRFDLRSQAIRQTRDLGLPAISVGYGLGSVWLVVADGSLLRIDPGPLRVVKSIRNATTAIEASEPKLAFDRGSVWISSPAESNVALGDQSLVRLDPASRHVRAEIELHHRPVAVAAGGGLVAAAIAGAQP